MNGLIDQCAVGAATRHVLGRATLIAVFTVLLVALVSLPADARGPVGTPKHGPLSKRPTITPHKGSPPRRLVWRDIVRGSGRPAKDGDMLTTNYVGALYSDGKVFDSSWRRSEPFTFALGSKEVIEGWERGLRGMRVGGRRELIIPPALAYGRRGSPPKVPPNSTLVFVVDLLAA
jgi:FKBP-type peptidyl-prolyl cis-trans isomerase